MSQKELIIYVDFLLVLCPRFTIGASAGISVYPDDSSDSETMLQHADMAMYQAKEKGRNCWRQYMVED